MIAHFHDRRKMDTKIPEPNYLVMSFVLTPTQCSSLIQPIMDEEIETAIISTYSDKALGSDGFSSFFF